MNLMQQAKYVRAISPAAIINNASAAQVVIDARDFDYCTIVVQLGATDIALTALKVESSTTSGGVYADITGATFAGGTSPDGTTLALPSATDDSQTCVFQIDMRGKNPFLRVVATFGSGSTGGFIAAVAILTKAHLSPATSATMADGDVCRVL
jgi:hypothetical protein